MTSLKRAPVVAMATYKLRTGLSFEVRFNGVITSTCPVPLTTLGTHNRLPCFGPGFQFQCFKARIIYLYTWQIVLSCRTCVSLHRLIWRRRAGQLTTWPLLLYKVLARNRRHLEDIVERCHGILQVVRRKSVSLIAQAICIEKICAPQNIYLR